MTIQSSADARQHATAEQHAAAEWTSLRGRMRTVTPQALARAGLATGVGLGALAVTVATWPALLPFAVGALIAYALLPVVDALDGVMPRFLAAILAVGGAAAAVIAGLALVLPPLAAAFVRLAAEFPTSGEMQAAIDRLQAQLGTMPDGTAALVAPVLTSLAAAVTATFSSASPALGELARVAVSALLNALGALLGLIVLPAWMLTVITQKRRARAEVDRRLAPVIRRDAWAVVAIVDRAIGAYVRGYVLVGGLVGVLAYVGLMAAPRVGGPTFQEPLALAVFAGATQVIPVVGPLLGLVPVLLALPLDPGRAAAYLAVYVAARYLGSNVIGSRVSGRNLRVHPAILVPAVVAIGQLGPGWLFLSAPIIAAAADLIRYAHGRLSEPPRPAGVLPWSPRPTPAASAPARPGSAYSTARAPAPLNVPAGNG